MPNRWNCPFEGLGYFLSHPRLWGWAFLGVLLAGAATLFAFVKTIAATYPHPASFWLALRSFGWGALVVLFMVLFVFPFIFNTCFAKALTRQLKREGSAAHPESFWSSLLSSSTVFLRTLKWRVLWPLILLAVILFLPILIFPVSLLAANHLLVIESVDLVLSLFGMGAAERARWIQERGRDCLAAALSGSLLAFLLSLILIGWILWIPALYCGVFLWLRSETRLHR